MLNLQCLIYMHVLDILRSSKPLCKFVWGTPILYATHVAGTESLNPHNMQMSVVHRPRN